jgi:hypothetical protein
MNYVCIENNLVVSILNYKPTVPNSVEVIEITDSQADQITARTHYFDVPSRSVTVVPDEVIAQQTAVVANSKERAFLNSTDWKVLRHLRQKALNIPTSLSDAEYLELEQQRQAAAARIQ